MIFILTPIKENHFVTTHQPLIRRVNKHFHLLNIVHLHQSKHHPLT